MRSKRERKNRERNSLKRKQKEAHTFDYDEEDIKKIEPESIEIQDGDTNAQILPTKKRKTSPDQNSQAVPEKKISKKEQRKMKQIAREKGLKAQREQVYQSLARNALPAEDVNFLRSSSSVGQRETKRQRVEREFKMQKAGKIVPEDQNLTHTKKTKISPSNLPFKSSQEKELAQVHRKETEAVHSDSDRDDFLDEGDNSNERESNLDLNTSRLLVEKARAELGLKVDSEQKENQSTQSQIQASLSGKKRLVKFERLDEIQKTRLELPILSMEQEIMEAVLENDVIVLSGETGCGKTTQVPQFLLEAGYGCKDFVDRNGMIGVTQPRRVAATASANRVAKELNTKVGSLVGFQIRYDQKLGKDTSLKFMTDGILLREAQADFLLRKYSCLIIDEAHERSLNTDLLIGLLSRIVPLRRSLASQGKASPLKLIIMSATLRTEDFVGNRNLFPIEPPLVHVPARQYPVTIHFSKKTELYDYTGAAFQKVSQIHRQLPPGGILVFVTGQREVEHLCRKLRDLLNSSDKNPKGKDENKIHDFEGEELEASGNDRAEMDANFIDGEQGHIKSDEDDYESGFLSEEEETHIMGGEGFSPEELAKAEARFTESFAKAPEGKDSGSIMEKQNDSQRKSPDTQEETKSKPTRGLKFDENGGKVKVLSLYAMLPSSSQAKVFGEIEEGHRLIVVATNVAETSLTIPGIRYVVDAGRSKQKLLEENSGIAKYEVGWISKASAEQRAGRAGRTGPGHCYRLFSSAVFNDQFIEHTPPEIQNTALESVVLIMKAMGIEKVVNFPYPSAPNKQGLQKAINCLKAIGAISHESEILTRIGRNMASLPINPRHAKMIIQVQEMREKPKNALAYTLALAASMSAESPFIHTDNIKDEEGDNEVAKKSRNLARAAHERLRNKQSDSLSALNALLEFDRAKNKAEFCRSNFLHGRNLAEMSALFSQLKRIMKANSEILGVNLGSNGPVIVQLLLRKTLTAGWIDQVAKRVKSGKHVNQSFENGKKKAVRYQCASLDEEVFLHPNSSLYRVAPEFVAFTQLVRSTKRPYMTDVTEIDPGFLHSSQSPFLEYSEPLDDPPPKYSEKQDSVLAWHDVTFGKHAWNLPRVQKKHPDPETRYRFFAAALLQGFVFPSMKDLQEHLIAPANSISKGSSQGLPRVGLLLQALREHNVESRSGLKSIWESKPSFLKPELAAWFNKAHFNKFLVVWSELHVEFS